MRFLVAILEMRASCPVNEGKDAKDERAAWYIERVYLFVVSDA